MTPHNKAKKDDIAKTVVMPGDPMRAKWISETFLENARLVNDVRGILAFTGTYKGKPLTVMAHGMGIPSIGIYTYELYKFYDVDTIIRIGSAGSYTNKISVGDVIITEETVSFSDYAKDIGVDVKGNVLSGTKELIDKAVATARESGINARLCRVFTSDVFYNKYSLQENIERSDGCDVVEMEGFALFANALFFKKKALMLLTCSDSIVTGEEMNAADRQTKFESMVKLALSVASG